MKKTITLLMLALLIIPTAFALSLSIEKLSSNEVMISGVKKPVVFDLKIKNAGEKDFVEFYNLLGFQMFPIGTTQFNQGQTKNIKLEISPIGEFNQKGYYTFQYFIRGQDSELSEELTFKIVEFEDAFEIGADDFNPQSNSVAIFIKNKENFNFGQINAELSSVFFDINKNFSLGPKEKQEFTVQLNTDDFKKLIAGFYTLNAKINAEGKSADFETSIKFSEKDIVDTTSQDYGFLINTKIIEKINSGNTVKREEVRLEKNLFSMLFTSFSPEPSFSQRDGFAVSYTWNQEIKPGENLKIIIKTNWLFPIITILFLITAIILIKQYTKTHLDLKKQVSFVRTKGGEFALKVSIIVSAKDYIEKVNIIDRLPALVKVYEKFGAETPSRVDEKKKRIEWNFEQLESGEKRIISYVIYSRIGVMGKFALPSATAIYDHNGKISEAESNRAFFVAEETK